MKHLLQLVVAALVIFGVWNAVSAQWDHFQFDDAVKHIAEFSSGQDEEMVRIAVLKEAVALNLPITQKQIVVEKTTDRIRINVAYTMPVRILPWYRYNWAFSTSADGWFIPGGRIR